MKGVYPWLVRWARRACKINVCSALAALVSQYKILFSSHNTYSLNLVPIVQQPGQAAVLGRLSLCLCLCFTHQRLPDSQ
jgi:hypothetical protein